jgi:hypothetical protein
MFVSDFGCEQCFKADAEAMARAKNKFNEIARLVDEEHFIIRLLSCPACGQRCVSVFTESIDWSGGDDAQYVSVLPITAEEAELLQKSGENLTARINAMGCDRRHWRDDSPTGGPRKIQWDSGGLYIGPHD